MARDTQHRQHTLATLERHDQPRDSLWPGREAIRRGVLFGRWNLRYDLTPNKKYSLAPMTASDNPLGGADQKRVSTPLQALYLSASQTHLFFWLMVVLEPALVFGIGLIVYIRRRKQA
jgi:hypothetical protein